MQARFLELAKKHDVTYGDVQNAWQQSAIEARKKRYKPGTPKGYEYRFNRLEEIVLENKAAGDSTTPVDSPVDSPTDEPETDPVHEED